MFTPKKAERFYQVLLQETAKSEDEGIEACINIIGSNLCAIIKALQRLRWKNKHDTENTTLDEKEIYASYAEAVISVILSDEKVAKYIVTGRLDFLLHLLKEIKKNNIDHWQIHIGLEKLFELLFREENSYFYKQLDYRGISLATDVFEIIFSDPYFINRCKIFSSAYRFCSFSQLNEKYLTVYLKALEYTLKGFWEKKCPWEMGNEIARAFDTINYYSKILACATYHKDTASEALAHLQKIQSFLGNTYRWEYRNALTKELISDDEKQVIKNRFNSSVNYAYAKSVYHFIESLAIAEDEYTDQIRDLAICIEVEIICDTDSNIHKIQEIIIGLLWEKINGKNMSNEQGWYPAVLKIYIEMFVREVSTNKQEHKKLIDFLYKTIKPKIINNEKMANRKETFEEALLPKSVVFNRETGNFEYIMSDGEHEIIEEK